jgi:hypothetical protein
MREIPILFTGPMVNAIRENRKTQTRRIVTPQPNDSWSKPPIGVSESGHWVSHGCQSNLKCPYGTVRDHLWVREAWAHVIVGNQIDYLYRADHHTGIEKKNGDQKWKPSIHMPKVACRLMLEVTGVKVERVQEISETDAIAEGCSGDRFATGHGNIEEVSPSEQYKELWEKINGPNSWASNPFVWVIEFQRLNQP